MQSHIMFIGASEWCSETIRLICFEGDCTKANPEKSGGITSSISTHSCKSSPFQHTMPNLSLRSDAAMKSGIWLIARPGPYINVGSDILLSDTGT